MPRSRTLDEDVVYALAKDYVTYREKMMEDEKSDRITKISVEVLENKISINDVSIEDCGEIIKRCNTNDSFLKSLDTLIEYINGGECVHVARDDCSRDSNAIIE